MKKMFLLLMLLLVSGTIFSAEFDPVACPDFSVRFFPGNNRRAVILVSASTYLHPGLGFDSAECRSGGKPSGNRFWNLIHLEMAPGKKTQLYYLSTIPGRPDKISERFDLAIDRPFFKSPEKKIPLKVARGGKAVVVFTSYLDSAHRKSLRSLKINLEDNTGFWTHAPESKLKITWHTDGFSVAGQPGENAFFEFDWTSLKMFRRMENGVTALRLKHGYKWGFFPVYEIFYLRKIETDGSLPYSSEFDVLAEKPGCTGAQVFARPEWRKFFAAAKKDPKRFEFLLTRFSVSKPTQIHICNWENASQGVLAVMAVEIITGRSWMDYDGANPDIKKCIKLAKTNLPQHRQLKKILTDPVCRRELQNFFRRAYQSGNCCRKNDLSD